MAENRTVYHVVPNADVSRWVVTREDNEQFREEHPTKDEAVRSARRHARSEEPSQVKVHRQDGNMEYENTYGDDPSRFRAE